MLHPITEQEKAQHTLKIELQRATEELLSEAYESGYNGYIDIWPVVEAKKKQLVFTVQSKKITIATTDLSNKEAMRYHVVQGKGCKRVR